MHPGILDDDASIAKLLQATRRIAVLGIKTEEQADTPATYVPRYLVEAGFDLVPVPVYYPDVQTIFGRPVFRSIREIPVPPPLDLVDVFRRSKDLPTHLDDLLAAKPRAVWLQTKIRDDAFAEALAKAGILVVQDRCLMVEHRRLGAGS